MYLSIMITVTGIYSERLPKRTIVQLVLRLGLTEVCDFFLFSCRLSKSNRESITRVQEFWVRVHYRCIRSVSIVRKGPDS